MIILENSNPKELFVMNGLDAFINKVKKEVSDAPKDISTEKGRKAIISLSVKVRDAKKEVERLGKTAVEDLRAIVNAVTKERLRGEEELQKLQDEIRQPVTDWENAEEERIAGHEETISYFNECGEIAATTWQNIELSKFDEFKQKILDANVESMQEFVYRAKQVGADAIVKIEDAKLKRTAYDAEQAELARLRVEQAAREQKEREDKIAADAAEKARLEAERLAKIAADAKERERIDAERAAQREIERQEREKQEAVARAEKAEADRIYAENTAKLNAELAAGAAERGRVEAAAKAEREKQEAVDAEKKRQQDETDKIAAETKAREADLEHKKKINNEIFSALMHIIKDDAVNKAVITAIAHGKIPHLKINY